MQIMIDKNLCIGCGTCEVVAPKTFKLNADGKAQTINSTGDPDEKIKEAIDSCLVDAIKVQ